MKKVQDLHEKLSSGAFRASSHESLETATVALTEALSCAEQHMASFGDA